MIPGPDWLASAHQMHDIGSRGLPEGKGMRGDLAFGRTEAADVDAFVLAVAPDTFRKQIDAQNGVGDGPPCDSVCCNGLARLGAGSPRMEERLEVDKDRVFAGCDEIATVEIRAIQNVQESDVRPLSLVEPVHLVRRPAFPLRDVLR